MKGKSKPIPKKQPASQKSAAPEMKKNAGMMPFKAARPFGKK